MPQEHDQTPDSLPPIHTGDEPFDNMWEIIRQQHEADRATKPKEVKKSFRIPIKVQETSDVEAEERDREFNRLDAQGQWMNTDIQKALERQGLHLPQSGEEIDDAEQASAAEARAEASLRAQASETHATNLHQKKTGRTGRLKNPPKPGRGGDKNVPDHVRKIDDERII